MQALLWICFFGAANTKGPPAVFVPQEAPCVYLIFVLD